MRSAAFELARITPANFFADKPPDISRFDWLFDCRNRYCFGEMAEAIILKLRQLMGKTGWAWPFQKTLAEMFSLKIDWIKKIISWLEDLGILLIEKFWNGRVVQNRYQFAPNIFKSDIELITAVTRSTPRSTPIDTEPHQVTSSNTATSPLRPASENKDIKTNYRISGGDLDRRSKANLVVGYEEIKEDKQALSDWLNTVGGTPDRNCLNCCGLGMRYVGNFLADEMEPCPCVRE